MADELKPCPFCKGEARLEQATNSTKSIIKYGVRCWGDCKIHPYTRWYATPEEAVEAWNKRQP